MSWASTRAQHAGRVSRSSTGHRTGSAMSDVRASDGAQEEDVLIELFDRATP
jgi:hypothetical protein